MLIPPHPRSPAFCMLLQYDCKDDRAFKVCTALPQRSIKPVDEYQNPNQKPCCLGSHRSLALPHSS
jgi:hypothetical protein